jgi:predicted GNAT superfamily acetyltransferase
MMKSCVTRGGIALGAFDPDQKLCGFLFGFPVCAPGLELHHSHMLAIHSHFRDFGIGTSLKLAQKKLLQKKLPLITWTYDPLEARNAHLNFNKLGIVVRHYYRDLYGTAPSSLLHQGIGTDRFLAEWWINLNNVSNDYDLSKQAEWCLKGKPFNGKFRQPSEVQLDLDLQSILLEIPNDIQKLKNVSSEISKKWRIESRHVLTHYLEKNYQVEGFHTTTGPYGNRIPYYRLEKKKSKINAGGRNPCK